MDSRDLSRKDTGLVYDNSMAEHECLWDKNYPECPKRLTRTLERCNELGLISRCKLISPRLATDKELLQKHTQKQIDILKATDGCTDLTKLEELSSRYDAIYIHPVRQILNTNIIILTIYILFNLLLILVNI